MLGRAGGKKDGAVAESRAGMLDDLLSMNAAGLDVSCHYLGRLSDPRAQNRFFATRDFTQEEVKTAITDQFAAMMGESGWSHHSP